MARLPAVHINRFVTSVLRFMFRTFARSTRHFLTAIVLLLVVIVVTEVVLQFKTPPPAITVTSRVESDMQKLLAPSATTHHEMLRLSTRQTSLDVTIATNSFGLRGDEPDQPKPATVLRVLLLGDDTILGPELVSENTVPNRLKEFLSAATGTNVEVINAGVPGYCPLLSLLQYRHQLQQLNPDIVVLHFDMTDVSDDAVYRRALKDSQGQQICVNQLLAPERRDANSVMRTVRQSALVRLLQTEAGLAPQQSSTHSFADFNERYRWTTASRVDLRLQIQHALMPIEQLAKVAEQGGFRLLISSAPTPWQVASADGFPQLSEKMATGTAWPVSEDFPYQILNAICERSSIPFCNATLQFREFSQPAKLFLEDAPRLSRYGAALYAREIASMLLSADQFAGLFAQRSNVSSAQQPIH